MAAVENVAHGGKDKETRLGSPADADVAESVAVVEHPVGVIHRDAPRRPRGFNCGKPAERIFVEQFRGPGVGRRPGEAIAAIDRVVIKMETA